MKKRSFSRIRGVLVLLAFCAISALAFLNMARVPINSDFANHVLEGADWVNGNFFLKGWTLTGISFLTTELPYYGLSAAILGIQPFTYVLAAGMIWAVFLCLGFALLRDSIAEISLLDALLYFAVAVAATTEKAGHFRGHTAAFSYVLLIFWLVSRTLTSQSDRSRTLQLTALFIVTSFGVTGDFLIAVVGVLPTLLFAVWEFLSNEPRFSRRQLALIAGLVSLGTIAGIGLDRLYFALGGAVKNEILGKKHFAPFDQIGVFFSRFVQGFIELANGSRYQLEATPWNAIRWAGTALILLAIALALAETLRSCLRREHSDIFAFLLALSMILMTGACIWTDVLATLEFTRYFSFMIVFGAILIVRAIHRLKLDARCFLSGKISASHLLGAAALMILAANLSPLTFGRPATRYDRIARCLVENGFEAGLAHFWNASSVTVSARNQVRIRSITIRRDNEGIPLFAEEQRWFYRSDWFNEELTFVLLEDDLGYLDVSREFVTSLFGEPERTLRFETYEILDYGRNLVPELEGRHAD